MMRKLSSRKLLALSVALLALVFAGIASAYDDGEYFGEAKGNNGPIKVRVVVDNGKIAVIDVLGHEETPMISDAAIDRIPAAIIEAQSFEVDTVTGASYTSRGIMEAVKRALNPESAQTTWKDGVYEGQGKGNNGPIKVVVTVQDGRISSIEVVQSEETPMIWDAAKEHVIADIIAQQSLEVDTVTGATNSSNGIMAAVKDALK